MKVLIRGFELNLEGIENLILYTKLLRTGTSKRENDGFCDCVIPHLAKQ